MKLTDYSFRYCLLDRFECGNYHIPTDSIGILKEDKEYGIILEFTATINVPGTGIKHIVICFPQKTWHMLSLKLMRD